MATIRHSEEDTRLPVAGWSLLATAPGAVAEPTLLPSDGWIAASVPGTVAGALLAADPSANLADIDTRDHWYRTRLIAAFSGRFTFEGLATLCEVWLEGAKLAESRSMFMPLEIEVDLPAGAEIALCFRALGPALVAAPRRARWRPAMVQPNGLRWFRTSALGAMDGWCPPVRPVGPYRPIRAIARNGRALSALDILRCDMRASLNGTSGTLDIRVELRPGITVSGPVRVSCRESSGALAFAGPQVLTGQITVSDVRPWFPHTHGEPALYPVELDMGSTQLDLGKTGFRSIAIDRDADGKGFGLIVNGTPVFCRGASWSNADVLRLPCDRAAYEPWLRLARDAGMNMIRVSGVMTYESNAFFDLCDELGLMVWQDMMLANFDYPQADIEFADAIRQEAEALLDRTQAAPSLVVLCGGSEVFQQAAMLGAPPEAWSGPVFDEIFPVAVEKLRPDIAYVRNSPSGGALPFVANEGVTHYYGVGAYMRDLDDARRANVRFAAECLAFANVPEEVSLGGGAPPAIVHHPDWKRGVPRDAGASWDFDDVRDHYLERLYGVSTLHLRRDDPERYFALSRAATAEVMEATFAEWRRPGSPTRGALVWFLQDLQPGAGWGVVASDGEPKSGWYAMRRAFRPVQLAMTDEGVNGLALHVVNERAAPLLAEVSLTAWREGATPVAGGKRMIEVAPRAGITLSGFDLLGSFFDLNYAYRFGPPGHDVTSARLSDATTGAVLAEAFHFPLGRGQGRHRLGLKAELVQEGDGWLLAVSAGAFAQSVHIVDESWRPADNWFHLAPGEGRRIALSPRGRTDTPPSGEVRAVNATDRVSYGG